MLPKYTIRESARAKHVRFSVTVSDGLVVVIPKGFDQAHIPQLLKAKQRWLMRALSNIEKYKASMPPSDQRPLKINLPAVGQDWRVDWVEAAGTSIYISEPDQCQLQVKGPIQDSGTWRPALRWWLLRRGRIHLVPWIEQLSMETGLHIERTSVRCQKTRWGSYSSRGTVSLNAQLLFLQPRLARYVLVHELCHVEHPDHSHRFWNLLRTHEPDADCLRAELRNGWRFVPSWLKSGDFLSAGGGKDIAQV